MKKNKEIPSISVEKIISTAIQIPGVKVDREAFLREIFTSYSEINIDVILLNGPVKAGVSRDYLKKLAKSIVDKRTLASSGASFLASLPGGWAMVASVPADVLQFFGVALRLAQEIAYIYGESDFWQAGHVSEEKVTSQLILYCGVMLGAGGASAAVRAYTVTVAKNIALKSPKIILPNAIFKIINVITKSIGIKITNKLLVKGASTIIPVIGGVISGGITFASMRPMGNRLIDTFDEAYFDYTQEDFEADWREINETILADQKIADASREKTPADTETKSTPATNYSDLIQKLRELKALLDEGIITEEEFAVLKADLIEKKKF